MHNTKQVQHYLDVLLQKGSFVKAAKELYISQPYLTQLIHRIEKRLGAKIVEKTADGYSLTQAGLIYYHYLELEENNRHRLERQLASYVHPNKEVIKLGILESLGTYLLPEILPEFLDKNPNVEIQLFEDVPRINERRLLNGDIDCYVGQTPEALDSGLDVRVNGGERYYVVISPKSKYYQEGKFILNPNELSLKDLLAEPFVLSSQGSAIRHQVDGLFQRFQQKENIVLESSSVITATNLAIHGVGLTISAASIIKRIGETPINLLPIDKDLLNLVFFIATRKGHELTPGLKNLLVEFDKKQLNPSIH
ncbi:MULTISPECIES: LysR family transcriptional regulator [Lactobacillus]|uniref:LysR family transcriptional regulator n=1 Tax=Lactobacillus xujianguonis TaxID=2495899 RepID=A0A437SVR8_9LACO|nr:MULTISPECIES: LysR family transcriptional regulator [Lactobacillus]RVU71021.1 LysR family transcriptional regulator [Lactobacillus xujianguonis]RVU73909.1 LysR family transcriptional regulator [Lactobacillus xujianguonis]